tara:strand:- start:400 stop:846 length:447 start_codon:yes stop_codon:yes gene_type:complete
MRDLANRVVQTAVLAPVVQNATVTSAAIDLEGFNSAMISVATGVEGVTLSGSVFWTFILQHSDDDSTYTVVSSSKDVTDGSIDSNGIFLTLDDNAETPQVSGIGYIGGKRYLKVVTTKNGTMSTGTPISVNCIKGNAIDAGDVTTTFV